MSLTSTSVLRVTVNITDVNDNSPAFVLAPGETQYTASVLENVSPTELFVARATDADGTTINAQTRMSIVNDTSGVFSFSATPGNVSIGAFALDQALPIYAAAPADYEATASITFTLLAEDRGGLRGTITVVITVIDANDNVPQMEALRYNLTVVENTVPTNAIQTVRATDADAPGSENARITYTLVSGNVDGKLFLNEATGALFIRTAFDRETVDAYTLLIRAEDHGTPQNGNVSTVQITVEDVNDNAPSFTAAGYNATVTENGPAEEVVVEVTASDRDIGENGDVRYTITAGNTDPPLFAINATTGAIMTTEPLDFEAREPAVYRLTIQASDNGTPSRATTATVVVSVEDVNDNRPVFTRTIYSGVLQRIVPAGQALLSVTATDADSPDSSGPVTYHILSGNDDNLFALNSSTGALSTQASSCDVVSDRTLRIEARDGEGVDSLSSLNPAVVELSISDVNDNDPVFNASSYRRVLLESDALADTSIVTVSATDADCGDTDNLTYAISAGFPNPAIFSIDASTGEIILLMRLTVLNATHILTVRANDNAVPTSRSGTVVVEINIVSPR